MKSLCSASRSKRRRSVTGEPSRASATAVKPFASLFAKACLGAGDRSGTAWIKIMPSVAMLIHDYLSIHRRLLSEYTAGDNR